MPCDLQPVAPEGHWGKGVPAGPSNGASQGPPLGSRGRCEPVSARWVPGVPSTRREHSPSPAPQDGTSGPFSPHNREVGLCFACRVPRSQHGVQALGGRWGDWMSTLSPDLGFGQTLLPPLGLTPEVPTPYPEFKSHQLCNLGQVLTPFASWGWG